MEQPSSVFDFSVENLRGEQVKLSRFCNQKVLLIVNFSTSDEDLDKHFLELKDLKQKYCDGKKFSFDMGYGTVYTFSTKKKLLEALKLRGSSEWRLK